MEEPSNFCTRELPQEIIFDIFLCLPLKSLSRFNCVSKSWFSLLSSTEFLKTHAQKLTGYRLLMVASDVFGVRKLFNVYTIAGEKNSSITISKHEFCPPESLESPNRILGCCNGLVCLRKDLFTLMLLNPCTGNFHVFREVILYCESSIRYGFGYDASTQDYKVVKIFSLTLIGGRYENVVRVYSLKARSWSNILDFTSGYIYGKVGVFVNGALHWEEKESYRGSWEILTLDVGAKRFRKITFPSYEDGGIIYWTLGVSRGYLVACCNYDEPNKADMWVMNEYGVEKSWAKFVTISAPVDCRGYMSPLFVAGDGDEVLMKIGREIVLYNSRDGSFNRLYHYPLGGFSQFQVAIYFESLESV